MDKRADLTVCLEEGMAKLNAQFPQNEQSTTMLFQMVFDFLDADLEEMTDNSVYRFFLTSFQKLICSAFEAGVSKSYLRCLFKSLNNPVFVGYLGRYAKSRANDIKTVMDRFVGFFVTSWQGYGDDRARVLENIVTSIGYWIKQ